MKYRKLSGRLHQWHDQPSCSEWPESSYLEHETTPDEAEICPRCASIAELRAELEAKLTEQKIKPEK